MTQSKIVDDDEVRGWFAQGRTHRWMQEEYRRKYGVETVLTTWSNYQKRKGLPRRIERNDPDLIPWVVDDKHYWAPCLTMLRAEARRRAGTRNAQNVEQRLQRWLAVMRQNDTVVSYDPATVEGFAYVPREPGDHDLVRRPVSTAPTDRPAGHG